MVLKITYKVGGFEFAATAENIAQAYEYIQAVIRANSLNFPNQEETLSEYMSTLVKFKDSGMFKSENHIFKIETDKSDERLQHLMNTMQDAENTLLKLYGTGGKYCDDEIDNYRERRKAREAQWSNG